MAKAVLAEGRGSVPSTYIAAHNAPVCTYVCIHMGKTVIHIKVINLLKRVEQNEQKGF